MSFNESLRLSQGNRSTEIIRRKSKEKEYKIGNYLIKKTLGQGTFGKVRLGVYLPENVKVAIKILEKEKIIEKDDEIRVKREFDMLTKFNHLNVVLVSEIFENIDSFYCVMEYCEGGELFNYIVKKRRLSEEETAFFYYQLINGLEYIHSLGIVHRDLKPENLLLTKEHILKIIDFGLSNYFKEGQTKLLSTPCGSPCYASPEMVSGNKYNGFRIDVWSTGIILYAMLCGYLPFEDKDNDVLFKQILECKLDLPHHLSNLSKDLLKRILVTDPDKRITIKEIKKHKFYLKGKEIFENEFTISTLNDLEQDIDLNKEDKDKPFEIDEINKFIYKPLQTDVNILNKENKIEYDFYDTVPDEKKIEEKIIENNKNIDGFLEDIDKEYNKEYNNTINDENNNETNNEINNEINNNEINNNEINNNEINNNENNNNENNNNEINNNENNKENNNKENNNNENNNKENNNNENNNNEKNANDINNNNNEQLNNSKHSGKQNRNIIKNNYYTNVNNSISYNNKEDGINFSNNYTTTKQNENENCNDNDLLKKSSHKNIESINLNDKDFKVNIVSNHLEKLLRDNNINNKNNETNSHKNIINKINNKHKNNQLSQSHKVNIANNKSSNNETDHNISLKDSSNVKKETNKNIRLKVYNKSNDANQNTKKKPNINFNCLIKNNYEINMTIGDKIMRTEPNQCINDKVFKKNELLKRMQNNSIVSSLRKNIRENNQDVHFKKINFVTKKQDIINLPTTFTHYIHGSSINSLRNPLYKICNKKSNPNTSKKRTGITIKNTVINFNMYGEKFIIDAKKDSAKTKNFSGNVTTNKQRKDHGKSTKRNTLTYAHKHLKTEPNFNPNNKNGLATKNVLENKFAKINNFPKIANQIKITLHSNNINTSNINASVNNNNNYTNINNTISNINTNNNINNTSKIHNSSNIHNNNNNSKNKTYTGNNKNTHIKNINRGMTIFEIIGKNNSLIKNYGNSVSKTQHNCKYNLISNKKCKIEKKIQIERVNTETNENFIYKNNTNNNIKRHYKYESLPFGNYTLQNQIKEFREKTKKLASMSKLLGLNFISKFDYLSGYGKQKVNTMGNISGNIGNNTNNKKNNHTKNNNNVKKNNTLNLNQNTSTNPNISYNYGHSKTQHKTNSSNKNYKNNNSNIKNHNNVSNISRKAQAELLSKAKKYCYIQLLKNNEKSNKKA